MRQKGLSIFQRLLISHIAIGLCIIIALFFVDFVQRKDARYATVKSQFTGLRDISVSFFRDIYVLPVRGDLRYADASPILNNFLTVRGNEAFLAKSEAERLFLYWTNREKSVYLSARFIDAEGNEEIAVEGNRRLRDYTSLAHHPEDILYSKVYTLFQRLRMEKEGTILCEGPFRYQDKITFLAGIAKVDPEVGGVSGVVIVHCDLHDFFEKLAAYTIYDEHVARVFTDNALIFSSQVSPGTARPFYAISKSFRMGDDDQELFRVVFSASPRIVYALLFDILKGLLPLTIIMLLAMVFVAIIISRRLSAPITALMPVISRFADGDLTARAHFSAPGEIGLLIETLNQMAERFQQTTVSRDILIKEIAEREKLEAQLKNAYEQMKDARLQIVQSAKMASIGILAGGVAHEINNPLTGVLNNVQLIRIMAERKKDFSYGEFKELLSVIEESALRCVKITRSLLDSARASKGEFALISLNALIEKTAGMITQELNQENIPLRLDLQPDLPEISGKAQLLHQAILDMIANSRWAITQKPDKSGGSITLRSEYVKGDDHVHLYITDTGIGIPKENIDHIFEPFFTTKPVGEGTGLGLAVVYNIIKEHRGTIEVESRVNEGATFRIILPVR